MTLYTFLSQCAWVRGSVGWWVAVYDFYLFFDFYFPNGLWAGELETYG